MTRYAKYYALVGLVAFVASCVVLGNAFTHDDIRLIRDGTRLHGMENWLDILTRPYWPPPYVPDLYRPLTLLMLAAEYTVGGGSAVTFRIVSCALYVLTCLALLKLALRLMPTPVAVAISLLFAAHPLHSEALAIAVGQNELLIGLLYVAVVAFYVKHRTTRSLTWRHWSLVAAAAVVCCFAKESGITLFAVLLGADALLVEGSPREKARDVWKGYVALIAVAAAFLVIRNAVIGPLESPIVADALRGVSTTRRVVTMADMVVEWLRLFIWPAHLRVDYGPQEFTAATFFGARAVSGILIAIGCLWAIVFFRRRAPAAAFGLWWLAVTVAPVTNLLVVSDILTAERTLFVPSIGVVLAVGGFVAMSRTERWQPNLRYAAMAATAVVVVLGVAKMMIRLRIWRDTTTLMTASLADAPTNVHVLAGYADAMYEAGRSAEGLNAFEKAISLSPRPAAIRNAFAYRLHVAGNDTAALKQYELSIAENPRQPEVIANVAPVLIGLGRYQEAKTVLKVLMDRPNAPAVFAWMNRVADSAQAVNAPPGAVRIGVRLNP